MLVATNGDETSTADGRYPDRVKHSRRTLRDEFVTDVDRVLTGGPQGLAEPERALVEVEPQGVAVRDHEQSGGPTAHEFVAESCVDLGAAQLVHGRDRVGGLPGAEELGNDPGPNPPGHGGSARRS